MPHSTRELRSALVLEWNTVTLRVNCPYCLDSHRHGISGAARGRLVDTTQIGWKLNLEDNRRRSDCINLVQLEGHWRDDECPHVDLGGDYKLVFPGSNDAAAAGYGWEVDKDGRGFITVNDQGKVPVPTRDYGDGRTILPRFRKCHEPPAVPDDTESESDSLADAARGLNIGSSRANASTEQTAQKTDDEVVAELYQDPSYRKTVYFSDCCMRDISHLRLLCRQYPLDQLIGSVDEEGDTGALLAATEEKGLETLRWLHENGDSIHRANHYGRTPLMEAALWGRLSTVLYLTQQNINLQVRDGNGMRAVDLAQNTARNARERRVRGRIYREDGEAGKRREQIRNHLQHLCARTALSNASVLPPEPRRAFFIRKADGTLDVYRPQVSLHPPYGQEQKAFATLDRGPNYPYVNAMSGYSHTGWPDVLDNRIWTKKAEDLRAMLGLPEDKYAACHVEPQLLAYLLDRHFIMKATIESDEEAEELLSIMPTYSIRPIITVSKDRFCDNCREFFERFNDRFPEVNVTLHCVGDTGMASFDVLE